MMNVHDCAFLLDFNFENQRNAETQQRTFFVWVFTSKSESLFSANQNRHIVCPYDVELVTTSTNSWIKVIYWSAATNSKW